MTTERRAQRPEMPEWHGVGTTPIPTSQQAQAWLDRYVEAWISYDPTAISDLWSDDAVWYRPFDVRARGRDAITAEWMAERELFLREDYDARYEPIAISDDGLVVAHGRTHYFDAVTGDTTVDFDNVWVLRFDAEGRCSEFHEWYASSGD